MILHFLSFIYHALLLILLNLAVQSLGIVILQLSSDLILSVVIIIECVQALLHLLVFKMSTVVKLLQLRLHNIIVMVIQMFVLLNFAVLESVQVPLLLQ